MTDRLRLHHGTAGVPSARRSKTPGAGELPRRGLEPGVAGAEGKAKRPTGDRALSADAGEGPTPQVRQCGLGSALGLWRLPPTGGADAEFRGHELEHIFNLEICVLPSPMRRHRVVRRTGAGSRSRAEPRLSTQSAVGETTRPGAAVAERPLHRRAAAIQAGLARTGIRCWRKSSCTAFCRCSPSTRRISYDFKRSPKF